MVEPTFRGEPYQPVCSWTRIVLGDCVSSASRLDERAGDRREMGRGRMVV